MTWSGCEHAGFEEVVAATDAGSAGQAARGFAGGLHVELARGVGVEHEVLEDAALDDDGAARGEAIAVEGRGAEAAYAELAAVGEVVVEDHGAVVDHGDVFAGDLLAELAGEHAGVAIDGVAVGCGEQVAHQAAGDFGGEDDGATLRGNAARAEAAKRALGGDLADGFGAFEELARCGRRSTSSRAAWRRWRPGRWE